MVNGTVFCVSLIKGSVSSRVPGKEQRQHCGAWVGTELRSENVLEGLVEQEIQELIIKGGMPSFLFHREAVQQ